MRRRYYLYKRSTTGIFYCEFVDPEGRRLSPRSTRKSNRDEAMLCVAQWLNEGLPSRDGTKRSLSEVATAEKLIRTIRSVPLSKNDAVSILNELKARGLIEVEVKKDEIPESELLSAFLERFWNYEISPYIAERLAHGQRATKRHCEDMYGRSKEIIAILGALLRVNEVKRSHLITLGLELKKQGLAAATINKDLSAITTPLRWLAANETIPTDPTRGIRSFAGPSKKRGILEASEVRAIFSTQWEDERARVASLTSATTGARLGEVLAIRSEDIGEDRLFIRHSFSLKDGLKSTKNGEAREVPLLPIVREALLNLEAKSPHPACPERFVFAGRKPNRPLDANRILLGMRKALVSMNGKEWRNEEDRKKVLAEYSERNIDFHSWRHWYAKVMTDKLGIRITQQATGHKTAAMLEHYADHIAEEDLARLGVTAGEVFGSLVGQAISL